MARILLVGAGQLGSRYLQGLVTLKKSHSITVVDNSDAALAAARILLNDVKFGAEHDLQFSTSMQVVPHQLDLALVVTPAHCRSDVVKNLANQFDVKSWVLEKVLAQSDDQLDQINHALIGNHQVWVNTSRRLMPWYQEIKSQLLSDNPTPLEVNVRGGSWGLACNAIHFIDLVAWWTQSSVKFINATGLDCWVQSKRSGFHEVLGSINVTYDDGSELTLRSDVGSDAIQITVSTSQGEWIIDESVGRCSGPLGLNIEGRLDFQSAITPQLVIEILETGNCRLPTLAESTSQHRPFLAALLKHWNQFHARQDFIIPIT